MTKGTGQFVLGLLTQEGIVSPGRPQYYLNPNRLAEVTGVNYAQFVARSFEDKAIDFIQEALKNAGP